MNRKIFRGALLETILLDFVNGSGNKGVHGYAIFTSLKKRFGIRIGPSTLYPELKTLERQGLIASEWELAQGKARRKYRITIKGQRLLQENFIELKLVVPAFAACKT